MSDQQNGKSPQSLFGIPIVIKKNPIVALSEGATIIKAAPLGFSLKVVNKETEDSFDVIAIYKDNHDETI